MFDPGKVITALEQKQALFQDSNRLLGTEIETLLKSLTGWADQPATEIETALQEESWPGALPSPEQEVLPLVIPFGASWKNHREARVWALQTLEGTTTFAADGSQITPAREVSIPVGVVQIGWFENRHVNSGRGDFEKNIAVEILTPSELAISEHSSVDAEIEWWRFKGEIEQIERFMSEAAQRPEPCVAFFDGSLIVSFIQHLPVSRQLVYIRQIEHLLVVSEQTQIPFVAYVDTSFANDVTTMLAHLNQLGHRPRVSDAALLGSLMPEWGSRSRLFRCARKDRVLAIDGKKYYKRFLVTYLRTTAGNPPARLEIPDWVLAAGKLEQVLNIVRAECVVGTGYPYTLETADVTAVLTAQDRERFLALFQQFSANAGLPLRFSRKAISKRYRR